MRKVLPYLGASLAALALAWATPSLAQDPAFKDLDSRHWAYEAVNDLAAKQIITGYPEGYFRGKKLLTRYEFAIALKRALDKIMGTPGPQGEKGEPGDKGAPGDPGAAGKDYDATALDELKRLLGEFRNELTAMRGDIRDYANRLDALSKDVKDIKDELSKMPKFSGSFFVGIRTDRSRFTFFDKGGAFRPNANTQLSLADVVHDFHLKVKANLPGDTTFTGDLVASNYLSYRGGTLNAASVAVKPVAGGAPALVEQIFPYQAQIDIPIGLGREGKLTVGRYKHQLSPLTYHRPDLDPYFDVAEYDDGNYVQDGIRLSTRFGSLDFDLFGGSYATTTLSSGAVSFNQPLIGGSAFAGLGFGPRQVGQNPSGTQRAANQSVAISLGVPVFNVGHLGVSAMHLATGSIVAGSPFSNATVYGAHFNVKPFGRYRINAEAAKSVTTLTFDNSDGQSNEDNNAYRINVGWGSGPIDVEAGYMYIDPRFGAPGYWLTLGNIINPTNIKGPFLNLKYRVSPSIGVHFGGNLLEGARNRAGFRIADNANRVVGGVNWKLSPTVSITGDYEGVFYDLSAATSGSGVRARPQEQYITIGTNLNLTSSATLKLAYQMINYNNLGGGFGAGTGFPGVGLGGGPTSNASVFTVQTSIRF